MDARGLAVGVVASRLGERGFLGGELGDDVVDLRGIGIGSVAAKAEPASRAKVTTKRILPLVS